MMQGVSETEVHFHVMLPDEFEPTLMGAEATSDIEACHENANTRVPVSRENADINWKSMLIGMLPPEAVLNFHLDHDRGFIVLYPTVVMKNRIWRLDNLNGRTEKDMFFLNMVQDYLKFTLTSYGFRPSEYYPGLLTMHLDHNSLLLDFLLEKIPDMMRLGTVFYTDSFKKKMVRKRLNLSVRWNDGNLESLLECTFSYDGDLDAEDLSELLDTVGDIEAIRYHVLRNGGFVDLRARNVMETLLFLKRLGITEKELEERRIQLPRCDVPWFADQLQHANAIGVADLGGLDAEALKRKILDLSHVNDGLPKSLQASLRPYQEDGFRWMKALHAAKLGGILADDMGLGKTLQAISLLLSIQEEKGTVSALVVVPTSLLDNWKRELARFAPTLEALLVTGSIVQRNELRAGSDSTDTRNSSQSGPGCIFISTYGLVLNDLAHYEKMMFDVIILDEAQKIKNLKGKTATSFSRLQSESRFALTGTPMENNLSELWSIFHWALPPLLKHHAAFRKKYTNDSGARLELRSRIRPYLLRRMRVDVLTELPEKTETILRIELSDKEKELYLAYRNKALELLEEKTVFQVLPVLMRLRQICCHPGMFMETWQNSSEKLEEVVDLVESLWQEGRKTLVFSQFTRMLDLIAGAIAAKGIPFEALDGRTPSSARSMIVDRFEHGSAAVFLISLKAGGTGLNLTAADTVIHCDPWWNPSVEEQATARVYRMGQKQNVQIFHLVAKGTIEERIQDVKRDKAELISSILDEDEGTRNLLTVENLRFLLE